VVTGEDDYDDAETVRRHRDFLANPHRYLHHLFTAP
jgi:hypothetical protein